MEDGVLVVGVAVETFSNNPHARDETSKSRKTIFFNSPPIYLMCDLAAIDFIKKFFRRFVFLLVTKPSPVIQILWPQTFQQSREMNTRLIPAAWTGSRSQHERGTCFIICNIAASGCIVPPSEMGKMYTVQGIQLFGRRAPGAGFLVCFFDDLRRAWGFHFCAFLKGVAECYTPFCAGFQVFSLIIFVQIHHFYWFDLCRATTPALLSRGTR